MPGRPRAIWLRIRERISVLTTRERALALALSAALAVALAVIVPAGARAVNAQSAGAFAQVIKPQPAVSAPSEFTGGPDAAQAITADHLYAARLAAEHAFHVNHENHIHLVAEQKAQSSLQDAVDTQSSGGGASGSAPASQSPAPAASTKLPSGCSDPSGQLTASQVEMVWLCAGGPAWAAPQTVPLTTCESGMNTTAHNPSGATGLFQILGSVVPGDLYDAHVNALNAVAKFEASGNSWAQWVCQP